MSPRRGDIWLVSFGAARTGEPGKNRPAVVVSADELNGDEPQGLLVVVPLSSTLASSALRPEIGSVAGLDRPSRAICTAVRGVARSRLLRLLGRIPDGVVADIDRALTLILALDASWPAGS